MTADGRKRRKDRPIARRIQQARFRDPDRTPDAFDLDLNQRMNWALIHEWPRPASAEAFGLTSVRTAPRSPWQNPYVERVIGSIRRECLDHVIVFNERHLRRVLRAHVTYYEHSRTHLALGKETPEGRPIDPVGSGRIVARPEVGGLHHRYERQAA